jgi:hypothetical protein
MANFVCSQTQRLLQTNLRADLHTRLLKRNHSNLLIHKLRHSYTSKAAVVSAEKRTRGNEDGQVFFATCIPGMEETVANELSFSRIGAAKIVPGKSGVEFKGSLATAYRHFPFFFAFELVSLKKSLCRSAGRISG